MDHTQLPISGYLDYLSRRPGERLTAYVSVADASQQFQARLVRVICGDPNPDGPGIQTVDLRQRFEVTIDAMFQPISIGSYGLAPLPQSDGPFTWTVLFQTAAPASRMTLLSGDGEGSSLTVAVIDEGLEVTLGAWRGRLQAPIRPVGWRRVWLSVDPAARRATLGLIGADGSTWASELDGMPPLPRLETLMFAAEGLAEPKSHFTGKLEAPQVLGGYVREWSDYAATAAGLAPLGAWDFAIGIATAEIVDPQRPGLKGRLVNAPTRGVVGAFWSGYEHCWRHAPAEYAAIHFHDDDLEDCRWSPSFSFEIPEDLPSGAYAFHLTSAGGQDWLTFYVAPARHGPFARVAFVAPTYTYIAYANSRRNNGSAASQERAAAWGGSPYAANRYPVYGCSTYDLHADGSGVCLSSRLRPMLSMRPGFISYNDPKGSGLRHYPADSHLLAWLEAHGIAFDVVTDEDLQDEGSGVLAPYETVLTATHPEYHTSETLDAFQGYLAQGGRLAYLGGNGFYWRIARNPNRPHLIEVRRAEGGIRTWAAEPGEYYNMLDGYLGGLWRRHRRPPQALVGVGFTAQGPFDAGFYVRTPASYDASLAWLFEGVEGERLGDYGLSAGGAAGFELDRADPALGTPLDAVVIARSAEVPASFRPVHEEMLLEASTLSGESVADIVRADLTYYRTPARGEVLSAGSITFCGSLWDGQAWEGSVSRLVLNFVNGT